MLSQRPITGEELALFNDLLSTRFGLYFSEGKKEILESRLRPRLQSLHLPGFMDYYLYLKLSGNGAAAELVSLVEAITNNETYFFRESYQFEGLFGQGLAMLKETGNGSDTVHVVCAGCSSGEEAYTLRFYAAMNLFALAGRRVSIDAIDIDGRRIEMAREGEYGPSSLRATSAEQIRRYFVQTGPDLYRVRSSFRSGIRFSVGNILERDYCRVPSVYDVVFCRNVLIYFSEEALLRSIDNFAHCMRPGGLLFLGHSESIIGLSSQFELVRLGRCLAYRKRR